MISVAVEPADFDLSDGQPTTSRALAWLLAFGGAVGLTAALILTIDKMAILQDTTDGTSTALACDFSAWVSCSDVIASSQSDAFGFPNSLIGVVGFTIVLTSGVWLTARESLPRFFWLGLQAGVVFAIASVTWLQYQSIFQIKALCPYCMVVWTVTIPIFFYVSLRNAQAVAPGSRIIHAIANWHALILALWYAAVLAAIWFQFGDRVLSF